MPRGRAPHWERCPRDQQPLTPGGTLYPSRISHLPLPLPSSTLGVHKHQEGVRPGPGADLEGRKHGCECPAAVGLSMLPAAELAGGPVQAPTCSPCPSTVVELNLKPWLSSGLVLAGESLSDLRQWDCLSFGEERREARRQRRQRGEAGRPWPCPAGSRLSGTYQDDRADVGRQQDVVPQRAPIALRLHVGGAFVVELKGAGGRGAGQGTPAISCWRPCPPRGRPAGVRCGVHPGSPRPRILTVTWHQTQCRPVMPW